MSDSVPQFYCDWFCPFAQRPWIAFLQKGINFQYIEQDPQNKTPEWSAISSEVRTPVIVHNGKTIAGSAACIEYMDETWSGDVSLLPKEPEKRAEVKKWCDYIEERVVKLFLSSIVERDAETQQQVQRDLLDSLKVLTDHMSPEGPFFLGEQLSMVDVQLIPFVYRCENVLKHYKRFEVPDDEKFARYQVWWKAALELYSVERTLHDWNAMISVYKRFAVDEDKSPE